MRRLDAPGAMEARDAQFATIIDVIDLAAGRVVASTRFEDPRLILIGAGRGAISRTDQKGVISVDIVRLDIITR
jgi:hypothetical protein